MFDEQTIQLLYKEAERRSLKPRMLTKYGVMSIELDGREQYLFHSISVLNTQLASYFARNKHAARLIMERSGLPNIPFCLPETLHEAQAFLVTHKKVIVKPTMGRHSQGIRLVEAPASIESMDLSKRILEKFIDGTEERYLVLNDEVIAVHKKVYTPPINDTNEVTRVAYEKDQWNERMVELAKDAAAALGLNFAAVDFLTERHGASYILEVNSAPGLARFQYPDEGPGIDIGKVFLDATLQAMLPDAEPREVLGIAPWPI